jgi:hypothetical protein
MKTKRLNQNYNVKTKKRKLGVTCCLYEKKATNKLDKCVKHGRLRDKTYDVAFNINIDNISISVLNHAFKHTESVGIRCYDESVVKLMIKKYIIFTISIVFIQMDIT